MELDIARFRSEEPDVFHGMVKMHLSFLLDLNTDDCDCSFVYEDHSTKLGGGSTPMAKESAGISLRKRIFTPKKIFANTPSSNATRGVMDGARLTHEGRYKCSYFDSFSISAFHNKVKMVKETIQILYCPKNFLYRR